MAIKATPATAPAPEGEKAPLRIVNLQVDSLKRIRAVNITPTGDVVDITGKNGAGKTSILDSIDWLIRGLGNVQVEPIRKGQERAIIRGDLGELIVTRVFRRAKEGTKKAGEVISELTIESRDGAKYGNPQTLLNSISDALAFDPLAVKRMKPRERFDMMRGFVAGVDFDAVDRANKGDFDRRTEVNRKIDELKGQITGIVVPEVMPTERVDEDALITEIGEVGTFNATLERRMEGRQNERARMGEIQRDAERKMDQAAILAREAEALKAEADQIETKLQMAEDLPSPKDAAAIQQQLNDAKANNATLDRMKRREELQTALVAAEGKAGDYTSAIAARNADKEAKIAAAQMPIEGLGFSDGDIMFNGIPFDQASDAEQLRISIGIAMANNPRLRVIRVRDGSLLDEDAMKVLKEMAGDRGYQVWMETVSNGDKVGIVIEDGMVKAVNEEPAAEGTQKDLLS